MEAVSESVLASAGVWWRYLLLSYALSLYSISITQCFIPCLARECPCDWAIVDPPQGSGLNLITEKMRNGEIFPKQWSLGPLQTNSQTVSETNLCVGMIISHQCLCAPSVSIDSARLTPEVILIFFDCRDKTYCYEKCIFLGHLLICIRQTATLSCFSEKQFELYALYISSGR